jgi:DOPA 4,5-dioxygenase
MAPQDQRDCGRIALADIHDFHAHIYFDPDQLGEAQALARAAHERFGVPIGHFHVRPVGPHPRGSCQMTVPTAQFGAVATWLAVNRAGLTIFAHASTDDDLADHSRNVVWLGESEPLDLSIFGSGRG